MAEIQRRRKRIIFMGTPPFAATILTALIESGLFEIPAVWCQPDRPAGRGLRLTPPAVKITAQTHDLPVFQPKNLKAPEDQRAIAALKPDFLAVAAYGLILPQAVLDIPRFAPLNVHASLLPKYRGAAPIQRAIMDGESKTGVSIMKMALTLDTGPVYAFRELCIGNSDSGTLQSILAKEGGELLITILNDYENIAPIPQDDSKATYAAKLSGEDGYVNWNLPAVKVHALIRGVHPAPGAKTVFVQPGGQEAPLGLEPGEIGPEKIDSVPGSLHVLPGKRLAVATADNLYLLAGLRPAGRKTMNSSSFINGYLANAAGQCGYFRSSGTSISDSG